MYRVSLAASDFAPTTALVPANASMEFVVVIRTTQLKIVLWQLFLHNPLLHRNQPISPKQLTTVKPLSSFLPLLLPQSHLSAEVTVEHQVSLTRAQQTSFTLPVHPKPSSAAIIIPLALPLLPRLHRTQPKATGTARVARREVTTVSTV